MKIINKHSGKIFQDSLERNLDFNIWIKENIKTDKMVTQDIDLILIDFEVQPGKMLLLEIKTNMAEPKIGQQKIYENLSMALAMGNKFSSNLWNYYGCHLIQFEKTSPTNGATYLDRKLITKEELERKLNYFDFPLYKIDTNTKWVKGDPIWTK